MKRLALILMLLATPLFAVQPDEVLDDPVLEERARDISAGLRCLVCRNESIDESNAELARDLRLLVRERLVVGDSNDQVIEYVVDRYGEYVLLNPRFDGSTRILWLLPIAMLGFGLITAIVFIRRRADAPAPTEAALSADEKARLDEIMRG